MNLVTREEAAKRQLNAAIRMLAWEFDPLAIHTVASAAANLMGDMLRENGNTSFLDDLLKVIIPEKQKYVADAIRRPENFLKHGHRGKPQIKYNPELAEYQILAGVLMSDKLGFKQSNEVTVFKARFFAHNPDVLLEPMKSFVKNYPANLVEIATPQTMRWALENPSKLSKD